MKHRIPLKLTALMNEITWKKYNNFLSIQYYQKKLLDYIINISKNEPGFAKITYETFLIKIIKYTLLPTFSKLKWFLGP